MSRKPLIIGHRGASAVAPENTIRAFKTAIEVGADGTEFDVQLSSDGCPVVIHDDNLRRTGLVERRVSELSAAQLRAIDVGQWFWRRQGVTESTHEGVPTLQEVFELYQSNPGLLYLEMKCVPSEANKLAQVCSQSISCSSLKERIVVESFDLTAIAELKALDSSIKTAALFEPKFSSPQAFFGSALVEQAIAVGADQIALHHRLVHRRVIAKAKEMGLGVVVWTVDDPRWLSTAYDLEIDALITNNPALMIEGKD